jgi:hypothetical protein
MNDRFSRPKATQTLCACRIFRAASARSEKIEFTEWALALNRFAIGALVAGVALNSDLFRFL